TTSMAPAVVRRSLSVESTIEQVDRYGLLRQQVAAKREQLASEAARERFHDRLAAFAQPVSFTNVVLLAATLHLVFRWKRRRFLEHAAFSMHAVSFVLLSSVTFLVAAGKKTGRQDTRSAAGSTRTGRTRRGSARPPFRIVK